MKVGGEDRKVASRVMRDGNTQWDKKVTVLLDV